uniref:G-type lectin S-receptor-like serine/threonine-protein kinase LECRK3 n=1 Tax=Tanacetum cinerariifolium TaxID=118510 RepID=A0A6L2P8B6_TANCI|nr:G-type lectin S-receptor-like serine/threonine-protein kinase LECRK3 [Tanacetum cinerariifolium]
MGIVYNKCVGRGLCGVNGYCMVMNDTARCQCLPRFKFVNTELWSLGCERNYTLESCKTRDAGTTFRMMSLIDVRWEDTDYEIAEASTQEKCSKSCLDESNCEAALFSGQECRLQKLPLRFVTVDQSMSNVGLIKVYSSSVKNGSNPFDRSIPIKKPRQMKILLTSVSLTSFAIIILLFSGVLISCRHHIRANRNTSENVNVELSEEMGPREFSFGELEIIINGFQEELGRGSFGIVYKGMIENSKKPHNILMDEYGCAKISDFGLAKLLESDETRTTNLIRGTRGYVVPEWHKKLPITVKVNVYSFGIVFFNILCCRRNVDNSCPVDEAVLAEWVYDCYEAGQVSKLVDGENIDNLTFVRMVRVRLWCIQEDPSIRPSMKKVLFLCYKGASKFQYLRTQLHY